MARAMKDSGVPWIGEIPQGWAVLRGKDIFAKRALPAFDDDEIVTCFRDGQVTLRKNRREDGFTIALKEHGYQGVRVGDLVVHAMDAFAGAIGISESNGKCSPVYSICRARQPTKTDLRFYSYVLRDMALNGYIQSVGQGIRERSTDFRFREVEVAYFCKPSLVEQRKIADYLDLQTALIDQRLDTLAEKKTVLAELRKAVIHDAVTKGLNKTAQMKDSVDPWIGDIPNTWQVSPLKYKFHFMCRGAQPTYTENTDFYITNQSCLSTYEMRTEKKKECEPLSGARGKYKQGDVLVASTGEGVLGKCVLSKETGYCDSHVSILRPKKLETGRFIFYWLSVNYETVNSLFAKGSTKQTELQKEPFLSYKIAFPPIGEQRAIVDHLDQQTAQIDAQLSTLDEQARVLKELRKSIIHEAVTGKIDLSDYTPPPLQALAA